MSGLFVGSGKDGNIGNPTGSWPQGGARESAVELSV